MSGLTLVETSQVTYAMGGHISSGYLGNESRNKVLQLDCPGGQIQRCQWNEVVNLKYPRSEHVAIALPESSDICETTTTPKTVATTTTAPYRPVFYEWRVGDKCVKYECTEEEKSK